jgi:hypothetical protein
LISWNNSKNTSCNANDFAAICFSIRKCNRGKTSFRLYSYLILIKIRQIEKVTLRTTQLLPFAVAHSLALQGFSLSFDCLKIKLTRKSVRKDRIVNQTQKQGFIKIKSKGPPQSAKAAIS